jgi:hypothetical protein
MAREWRFRGQDRRGFSVPVTGRFVLNDGPAIASAIAAGGGIARLPLFLFGFLGLLDTEARLVRYWGDGKTPIDLTTWEDTAAFTAAAAVDNGTVPEKFFVSGDRMDLLTLAKLWEDKRGTPLRRERRGSIDDLERETKRVLSEQPQNMLAWLPLMYARAVLGGDAGNEANHADRYPAIQPQSVADAIARGTL